MTCRKFCSMYAITSLFSISHGSKRITLFFQKGFFLMYTGSVHEVRCSAYYISGLSPFSSNIHSPPQFFIQISQTPPPPQYVELQYDWVHDCSALHIVTDLHVSCSTNGGQSA